MLVLVFIHLFNHFFIYWHILSKPTLNTLDTLETTYSNVLFAHQSSSEVMMEQIMSHFLSLSFCLFLLVMFFCQPLLSTFFCIHPRGPLILWVEVSCIKNSCCFCCFIATFRFHFVTLRLDSHGTEFSFVCQIESFAMIFQNQLLLVFICLFRFRLMSGPR